MTKKKDESFEMMIASGSDDYLENVEEDRAQTPRLQLVHALSEVVEMGDAKAGQIMLSTTEETFAAPGRPFPVIPLYYWRGRLLFPPRESGSTSILCHSIDGVTGMGLPGGTCSECPRGEWKKNDGTGRSTPPDCSEQHNFAFMLPGKFIDGSGDHIAVCSMGKTSLKVGRVLLNRLSHLRGKGVMFGYVFNLSSRIEEGGGNRYWIYDFTTHDETNRLEMPLNQYSPDQWKEILAGAKEAADQIRSEHKSAIEATGPDSSVASEIDTEVPF